MSFDKTFNKLCYTREPSIVFEDFLDFVIDQFLINPSLKYFNYSKYSEKEYELFFDLFKELINKLDLELNNGKKWFDVLGYFYEAEVKSKMKASNMGQFFTPIDVCDVMAELTLNPKEDNSEVKSCYDMCCGSGRLLLAHHSKRPFDICLGQDLDITSCKMAVINFILHGVKGSISHMNSITLDWFNGWKVNEMIDYGVPFTIMECNSESETYCFIGHNKKKEKVEIKKDKPVCKQTGQTVLM